MSASRRRVLVVEDDSATRTLLSTGLSDDYEVADARNGREAIQSLESAEFDSVVLDLMMPVLDGFGVLHFVEKHRPELLSRVIVVTGADDYIVRLVPSGKVFDVLTKPCGLAELSDAVGRCCDDAATNPAEG